MADQSLVPSGDSSPDWPDSGLLPQMDIAQLLKALNSVEHGPFSLWLRDGTYFKECYLSTQKVSYSIGGPVQVHFTVQVSTPGLTEERWNQFLGRWEAQPVLYRELRLDGRRVADLRVIGEAIEADLLRALPSGAIVEADNS